MEKHKIAWTDRIGLNRQWARDIEVCSRAYGTDRVFSKGCREIQKQHPKHQRWSSACRHDRRKGKRT